ncbi:MAG: prolyl oligopeptidase family serine peptidase, partial [Fimbriimonas ginsengisoli]|nr:prolyl oligopeptidase family serine peptidase [Fimbriimonas ginsengisoli]
VNAAVCLCPITDVTSPAERHFPISWSFLEQFMGVPYGGAEDRYRSASPVAHVDNQAAPLLLFHGDADDIVPLTQSELLASAYAAHRARCTLRPVPGEAHGFSMEAWPEVERLTLEFFAKELG